MSLQRELDDLIDRAASMPQGLTFVESAPVDCVATTLGVDAEAVARARASLAEPGRRGLLVEEFERARARWRSDPGKSLPTSARGPQALIQEAQTHPLGLGFLREGPLETVAITFSVHPFVVLGAREILERKGARP